MKVLSFNRNLSLIVVLCLITMIGLSGCQQLNATSKVENNSQETTTSTVNNSNPEDNLSSPQTNPNQEETTAQNNPNNITLNNKFMNLPRLEGNATVVMKINGQSVTIELDGKNAPITAGNFVDLVQKGVYNGSVFHRVIKEPQPFVVQGGDPQSTNRSIPISRLGTGSYTDPNTKAPRYIPLEIRPEYDETEEGVTPPEIIYSQTTTTPQLKHEYGVIAMARSQMPDSASAQFYFTLADLPFLDGNYAVFGRVTEGMDVVEAIKQGDRIQSAEVVSGAENLKK